MGRLVKMIALMLVFVLTPGAAEIVENAAHLAKDGHTAHAIDDAEHTPAGDEHGCSGTIHVCACHSSTCFMVSDRFPSVAPASLIDASLTSADGGHAAAGYRLGVHRPPAA